MSDLRIAVLIAGEERTADAAALTRELGFVAPYCRVHATHGELVQWSDVVLYLTPHDHARGNAGLIAFREAAGFEQRFSEPHFARVWFSANRKRSLYVLGAFPGAWRAVALALELGCGDPAAAARLRAYATATPLVAV